jgi:hypothetical protein
MLCLPSFLGLARCHGVVPALPYSAKCASPFHFIAHHIASLSLLHTHRSHRISSRSRSRSRPRCCLFSFSRSMDSSSDHAPPEPLSECSSLVPTARGTSDTLTHSHTATTSDPTTNSNPITGYTTSNTSSSTTSSYTSDDETETLVDNPEAQQERQERKQRYKEHKKHVASAGLYPSGLVNNDGAAKPKRPFAFFSGSSTLRTSCMLIVPNTNRQQHQQQQQQRWYQADQ